MYISHVGVSDIIGASCTTVRLQQIELISGAELQRLLDEHLERDFYRVFD